jgi:hypothetical protein
MYRKWIESTASKGREHFYDGRTTLLSHRPPKKTAPIHSFKVRPSRLLAVHCTAVAGRAVPPVFADRKVGVYSPRR